MTPFASGNAITLLETGAEYFPALEAAIAQARREIHLETYIFADDPTGRRIAAALAAAARRGVRVRVLVDGFGARNLVPPLRDILEPAGVHVLVFRPELSRFRLRRHRLRRMHRKLVVIDGETGFCGGINILDDLDGEGHGFPRFDYAVRFTGPIVVDAHAAVGRLWWLVRWTTLGARRERAEPLVVPQAAPGPGVRAVFLTRDNLRNRRSIEQAYLEMIEGARLEIFIANAYFLPGRRFRTALQEAVRRGVRVRVLLQGRREYAFVQHAMRALYPSLLTAGIELHEYGRAYLHAKVAVVDGVRATVGSSNIDPFSLLLSREANVFIHDAELAGSLRQGLERALRSGAVQIGQADLARQSWLEKLKWRAALALGRVLIGLTGYATRDDL